MGESAPNHEDLVLALLDLKGDLDALRVRFNLTTRQVLDFTDDPDVQARLENWARARANLSRIKALDHQDAAADALRKTLTELDNPVERRRAASALARLARAILAPPREPTPDDTPDDTPEPDDPPPGPDDNPWHHRLALNIAQAVAADDPDRLRTLHRQLADDAAVLGRPAAPDADDFLDDPALETLAGLRFIDETPLFTSPEETRFPCFSATWRLAFQREDDSKAHFILRFRRQTQHDPWLVTELNPCDPP